ncbi:alkanesulfonate monooxygenase [Azotobacter vinelandii CA]|uniref:Alkanesulfonate monooxygenase n=2 Tax=Azotobacter vinelandii TaxID=354 RepID=C1DG65_AZOVD|nr:LLM class flavin-dependent oxidoreductase [Azotobacter vinelandii]ACO78376.1 alkanesulfonate monooxygenase [Azotobacter vinelandii DJ]AGK14004.1 alkanesulfonate monooxygenase [Azotobacter vinelandii CA]AGK18827.1 alkanesulfonate monooxygenase [Azotobacter vinelandii CA6]SFY20928.1 alkanesulfonate monooxygenase [Azotobacter vinelandii]GLK60418.1 alkanesulfonate monooxygenase [Azotobacter vinelandii]
MSLEFIGFIGPQEASESLAARGPQVDREFIKAFAQAQEYGGFDKALLAVNTSVPDSLVLASYAAAHTERLGLLVAHRPGFQAPTFAARQFATLDQLSNGRAAINVITGGDSGDLQRDGELLADKDERYRRTDEYLDVFKKTWTSTEPFDHQGKYYQITDNLTQVKPVQKPHLPIFFSGASDAAVEVAAKHADVYMMWGEPVENIRERIAQVRKAAAKYGRDKHIRFSLSLRPILGATEEEAWARSQRILESATRLVNQQGGWRRFKEGAKSNVGAERLVDFSRQRPVHDKRLWTEIAALTGAAGNSTSLVGTPDQVAEAALDYYNVGVTTFLFRGFDPLRDAVEYGQELLPRIRKLVNEQSAAPKSLAG